jgi:hypothetical protein
VGISKKETAADHFADVSKMISNSTPLKIAQLFGISVQLVCVFFAHTTKRRAAKKRLPESIVHHGTRSIKTPFSLTLKGAFPLEKKQSYFVNYHI